MMPGTLSPHGCRFFVGEIVPAYPKGDPHEGKLLRVKRINSEKKETFLVSRRHIPESTPNPLVAVITDV
jgi:hypothetical protein